MSKRAIAAIAAVVLAAIGIVMLLSYTSGANERAYDGAKLEKVLRVTRALPSGTPAAEAASSVEVVELPATALAKGAISSLDDVKGLSTTVDLEPGEQVLLSRFAKPGEKKTVKSKSAVPVGMQEISIALDAEHAVGGVINPGDRVGLIATFEPKDSKIAQFTNVVLASVLVTRSKETEIPSENGEQATQMITLAVKTLDAERIVHAKRWGTVWLTLQNSETDTSGRKLITVREVVK